MRRSTVWIVASAFMANGVCHGFVVERYVQDHNDRYNFVEDVNAAKMELFREDRVSDPNYSTRAAVEVFVNFLCQPPVEAVRLVARVNTGPLYDKSAFADTKCRVIEEMVKREATQDLRKYGIDSVDSLSPILLVEAFIETHRVSSDTVYVTDISCKVNEVLIDPATNLKIIATTWEQSDIMVHESDKDLEAYILNVAQWRVGDFISEQYSRCVIREAKRQLEEAGKLPLWWKAKRTEHNRESTSKQ